MKKTSNSKLKKIQKELERFVVELGKKQIKWQTKAYDLKIHHKDSQGIATSADIESEKLILKKLKLLNKKYNFDAAILSEEMAYRERVKDYEYYKKFEYCWVVDPIDGTNNFANGIDYFSISIGLIKKGKSVMGLVYRPALREMFSAIKGEGCFYSSVHQKRQRIFQKPQVKDFSQLMVVNGYGMKRTLSTKVDQQFFTKLLRQSRAIRRMGSAALDFCFVASGKLDAYWERGLCPWDIAAGLIICQEANIKVTDVLGNKVDPFSKSFLLANKSMHKKLIKI